MREIGIRNSRYVNYRLAIADAISLPTQSCSKNIMAYPDLLLYTHRKQNASIPHATHQAPQTTLARIGYLPPNGQQVTLGGTDNVKIYAIYFTKQFHVDTKAHHISKNKARTLAARILHVMNNKEV